MKKKLLIVGLCLSLFMAGMLVNSAQDKGRTFARHATHIRTDSQNEFEFVRFVIIEAEKHKRTHIQFITNAKGEVIKALAW